MDTFFDRKQIVVGAVLLGCVELGIMEARWFAACTVSLLFHTPAGPHLVYTAQPAT